MPSLLSLLTTTDTCTPPQQGEITECQQRLDLLLWHLTAAADLPPLKPVLRVTPHLCAGSQTERLFVQLSVLLLRQTESLQFLSCVPCLYF